MPLVARMTRIKAVRHELVVSADGGIGLEVLSAPEAYFNLVETLTSD